METPRTYSHINDCWKAIREAKTIEEVERLFQEFPRWSGDWTIQFENNEYVVYNCYEEYGTYQTDSETLDITDLESSEDEVS